MGRRLADDVAASKALAKIQVWKASGVMDYVFTEQGVAQLTADQESVPDDVFLSFNTPLLSDCLAQFSSPNTVVRKRHAE